MKDELNEWARRATRRMDDYSDLFFLVWGLAILAAGGFFVVFIIAALLGTLR